ncbi:hypothetical protein [Staphylococcus simulans]
MNKPIKTAKAVNKESFSQDAEAPFTQASVSSTKLTLPKEGKG